MTKDGADQAVVVSAVTVAGIYAYRKLIEPAVPATGKHGIASLVGVGAPAPLGRFIVGYGVSFFVISLMATADPNFGGWMAILLMTAALLANGMSLSADVNNRLTTAKKVSSVSH